MSFCRTVLPVFLVLTTCFSAPMAVTTRGADRTCCDGSVCHCLKYSRSGSLTVAESSNFRLRYRNAPPDLPAIARLCEETRAELQLRWLGKTASHSWNPKCEVDLCSTASEFRQRTGHDPEQWGFADLDVGDGRVWLRGIKLRTDDKERCEAILQHELTHVVLADRFCQSRIPRWVDEGIALLSEPPARHQQLQQSLCREVQRGRTCSLRSLLTLSRFPADRLQSELLYAQSGSFVDYLIHERGIPENDILELVERIQRNGCDAALSSRLASASLKQIEADWHGWIVRNGEGNNTADTSK
ncbi:peptidase MA family metallohydrolase [Planctomicrobium sp. SH664]|uniref:peptidase MA family metallohydrolase n=1 Tax=Planctomicrobium sp. SH664 TaxID=3448125 RepID=UPI003F5BFE47